MAARVAEGADYVKVFLGDRGPRLSGATVRAVVAAAHAHGRIALVHAETGDEARMFIDAGGDALAHVLNGLDLDAAFLARLTAAGAFVVTTLRVAAVLSPSSAGAADEARRCLLAHPRVGPYLDPVARAALEAPPPPSPPATDRFDLDGAGRATRAMLDAGVPVVAGTDAPPTDPARPNPVVNALTGQGVALHHELELLVQAGLAPARALAAATSVAARCFGLGDRGRIAPGARADLLLVAGDPTRDVTATREIVAVWRRGVRLDRGARRP